MSSPAATDALTLHMLSPVAVDALTRRVNEQQTASPVTPFIGIAAFANIPTATKGDDNATNGDDNATNGYDSDDTSMPNAATPDVSVPRAAAEKRPMPDEHDASPSHKVRARSIHLQCANSTPFRWLCALLTRVKQRRTYVILASLPTALLICN